MKSGFRHRYASALMLSGDRRSRRRAAAERRGVQVHVAGLVGHVLATLAALLLVGYIKRKQQPG